MTRDSHAALCDLTEALYQREAARLRALRDEEGRLRAAIERLDAQARAARVLPQEALRGVREIGADIAWQGWLSRHRATIRDELARCARGRGRRRATGRSGDRQGCLAIWGRWRGCGRGPETGRVRCPDARSR